MTTMSIPTPAIFANKKQAPVPAPPKPMQIAAPIDLEEPGTIVRPGLVPELIEGIHDGVVKSKHLRRGQRIRPWVKDRKTGEWAPRGSERIVGSTERVQSGAFIQVTWASAHSPSEHKAAYRWFDASLVGTPTQHVVTSPGFVAYQEV